MKTSDYCADMEFEADGEPWIMLAELEDMIRSQLLHLGSEYSIQDGVAIHATAMVDPSATIQPPAIIGADCFVGPHALLRGGVYAQTGASIGPSCEVKHSIVGRNTRFAHFNFIGDSVIGANVNVEAGAVTANYYNERHDKTIHVYVNNEMIAIDAIKFGALIGDDTKIGANAVTSPGTILAKESVAGRLELVDQTTRG